MISKGTIITCPECAKKLFKANRDILKGERIMADDYSAIGMDPIEQALMVCDSCGAAYFQLEAGSMHTENGWS